MLNLQTENYSIMQNNLIKCIDRSLTDKQRESINKRLSMQHVYPVAIYKHRRYNTIVLSCINTNLNNPALFYFIYWNNGEERGRGYNFLDNNDSYILMVSLQDQSELII